MSLGIDIGKYSIKIVELQEANNSFEIKNIGFKNTFEDIKKFDLEKINKSQLIATIQDLCKSMNLNPKRIKGLVSAIPSSLSDVRQISTLDLPDEELSTSLEMEAKKHIQLDGTDTIIDYHHLGSHPTELDKINVLLVATTKNVIAEHSDMIKGAGFKPDIFDNDVIALLNIYNHSYELPEEGSNVILNIGSTCTNLIVWGKSTPFFSRSIDFGGNSITEEIMKKFNINYEEAEKLKFEKGTNVFNENLQDSTSEVKGISIEEKTIFNDLTEDIRKTLRYYMKNNNQSFFNTFYLSGGSAEMLGVKEFIASNLNVNVELLQPLNKIKIKKFDKENITQYSVALGLALRGLAK